MFSEFVRWNEKIGGAFYFYPADGRKIMLDRYRGVYDYEAWFDKSAHGDFLAIDEDFMPRALLEGLERAFERGPWVNMAIANPDHSIVYDAEWDYYGHNYYRAHVFRNLLEEFRRFRAGQDVWCQLLAGELEKVAAQAEQLGIGVMVTGP